MRCRCFLLLLFVLCSGISGRAEETAFSASGAQAARAVASLDDSALAAQVILTGIDGKLALTPDMEALLERIPAGGIMLFKYNLDSPKDSVKKLLSGAAGLTAGKTGIPPFMAVDHEGGLVHRFGPGVERLPSALSFCALARKEGRDVALARAEELYSLSAGEIRELGITMVLGPVAEPLSDGNREFLGTRSYGSDPAFTQAAASVFVRSMDAAGIATVLKHFPGNSAADPHSGASVLTAGKESLDAMVAPFAGIIRSLQPAAVMVSHVLVPALDTRRNASLSKAVTVDWLRGELGFEGIVIADDFSMGAVAVSGLSPADAAAEALNAGVDMVMAWPQNLNEIHASILGALKSGSLPRERLAEAAGRIIAGKIRCGLIPREPLGVSIRTVKEN